MPTSRRSFLQATAAAAAALPGSAQGANDRIQAALIGSGNRGTAVGTFMARHDGTDIVAVCDVDRSRMEAFLEKADVKAELEGDWRRIIDRNDIDAVIIATPDHWHSPITVAALEAGKHVYVEKPLSNTIAGAVKMLEASEAHPDLKVQLGTMQRSAEHFQEAARLVREGAVGPITQVVVNHGSGGSPQREMDVTPQPVPESLDWEMWLGDAPRHPFNESRRRSWRSWYDYGGGSLTDWGIHHVDVVHMALDADGTNPPLRVGGMAYYAGMEDPNPDVVPNTWSINVQYANFIMTIVSCTPPPAGHLIMAPGFWGSRGHLMINRAGYSLTPVSAYSGYATTLGPTNRVGDPPAQRRGGGAFGRGGTQEPPIEAREVLIDSFSSNQFIYESAHVWNWLDSIQSGEKPINDLVTGFNSHLACLMAVESIRTHRELRWDPATRTATPV